MKRLPSAAAGLLLLAASACAPASESSMPPKSLPDAFPSSGEGRSTGALHWTEFFEDKELIYLIYDALKESPDLRIALQRMEVARSVVRLRSGALLPQVSATAGAGLTRYGVYTPEGAGNMTTEYAPGRLVPNPVADYGVGLVASWEVDAWGRLRSERGAALARYLATVEARRAVQTSLVAGMAAAYFELLAWEAAVAVLEETILRQQRAVEATELQKAAGRATQLAVQQFVAQLRATEALAVQARFQIQESENRINLLRGQYPQPVRRSPEALLSDFKLDATTGLPSEVLRNRPDVREAEQLVRAAKLDLAVARAAFYPEITISAGAGFQAFEPRYLLQVPESVFYSATVGLVLPLVNRAAIQAEFQAAEASQIEAMYQYQKTILAAYAEVVTALAQLESARATVGLKQQQLSAVEESVETADVLYRAGRATYFEVLLAQENVLSAELDLIEAKKGIRLAAIDLYRALGGGWR